jgi:NADH:ubiquinone oxidoreductase subunit F (NADH-binding)
VPATALDVPYAPRPLGHVGGVVGAGVLLALPVHACGIAETARVARFMAGENAGQCGPCVFGLPAIAGDLERLAAGAPEPGVLARLHQRCGAVMARGGCRHPDGVARLVRSALAVFGADAASHAAGRPCAQRGAPSVLPTRPTRQGRAEVPA